MGGELGETDWVGDGNRTPFRYPYSPLGFPAFRGAGGHQGPVVVVQASSWRPTGRGCGSPMSSLGLAMRSVKGFRGQYQASWWRIVSSQSEAHS